MIRSRTIGWLNLLVFIGGIMFNAHAAGALIGGVSLGGDAGETHVSVASHSHHDSTDAPADQHDHSSQVDECCHMTACPAGVFLSASGAALLLPASSVALCFGDPQLLAGLKRAPPRRPPR